MRVAGSSLLYSRLSFEDACRRLSDLGFDAVDVGVQEGWAHLDPSAVVGTVESTAAEIDDACRAAGLDPVALNANAGDVALETEVERVGAVVDLADELDVPVVTLPAASTDRPLAEDLDRFRTLVETAAGTDVTLTVETHWDTLTEDPDTAAAYAANVPELGYTLDPGHFVVGVDDHDEPWAELLADVAHVHLRQAGTGWDEIQLPVEEGDIDVEAFVRSLRDVGYDETITVEYIDSLDGVDPEDAARQADELRKRLVDLV